MTDNTRGTIDTNNEWYMSLMAPLTMKYYAWNRIMESPSYSDIPKMPNLNRRLFELWDLGYDSRPMKELENNFSWRYVDLNTEIRRNQELLEKAKQLIEDIDLALDH